MAGEPLADQGCGEAEHRHTAIEALHPCQGFRVPGAARGEPFAELLKRLVLERGLGQGSEALRS